MTLFPPPAATPEALRIVQLGGLGEVGRNMAVFEHQDRILIIDCGVLFPDENHPGVDLILPDLTYLDDRLDDIEAIVLTHGHEDHIGAVPFLLKRRADIPLVGSRLTLALIEAKLREHRITPVLQRVSEEEVHTYGPFTCEFLAVNHSIPDALAVTVRTSAGQVLHTGDFKMDQLPLDGRITDLRAFARVGESGVDLFMVDSTNAEVPGFTTSEREIGPVLGQVFQTAERRVVVASFASHVHRVQQVIDTAAAHRRKVAFVGRSMVRNMAVAADLGYLDLPPDILIDARKIEDYPEDQVVLMCTGSQGEPMAALSRMANGEHKVAIGPGDTVILASSLIPGNETSVFRVINGLTKLGANVVHQGKAKVHVSGHASAGELLYCYNVVRPSHVMPVHGEVRHQLANAALAESTGVEPENIILAENGTVIDMLDGKSRIVGQIPIEHLYVDGASVGEITQEDLKARLVLGEQGFVSIFLVVDETARKIVVGPVLQSRGMAEGDEIFQQITPAVVKAVEDALTDGTTEPFALQQVMRRVVGRWAGTSLRRRPMIVPVVISL